MHCPFPFARARPANVAAPSPPTPPRQNDDGERRNGELALGG